MAGKHYPPVVSPEDNPLYHDTYKLLRCYRDSTYSLKVAVRQDSSSLDWAVWSKPLC